MEDLCDPLQYFEPARNKQQPTAIIIVGSLHCFWPATFVAGRGKGNNNKNNNNNVAKEKSLAMLQHVHASLFSYRFLRFALDSLDLGSQADADAGVHSIGL